MICCGLRPQLPELLIFKKELVLLTTLKRIKCYFNAVSPPRDFYDALYLESASFIDLLSLNAMIAILAIKMLYTVQFFLNELNHIKYFPFSQYSHIAMW